MALNIYAAEPGGVGTNFCTPSNPPAEYGGTPNLSVAPVNLASGDPIQVNLTYNAGTQTLTEALLDAANQNAATVVYTGVNFSTLLGSNSNSAYVGFTGATGTYSAIQTISNFSFSSTTTGTAVTSTYANNVVLPALASSSVNVQPGSGPTSVQMGTLTMGGSQTLNVAADGGGGGAYTLSLGSASVTAAANFNVASAAAESRRAERRRQPRNDQPDRLGHARACWPPRRVSSAARSSTSAAARSWSATPTGWGPAHWPRSTWPPARPSASPATTPPSPL